MTTTIDPIAAALYQIAEALNVVTTKRISRNKAGQIDRIDDVRPPEPGALIADGLALVRQTARDGAPVSDLGAIQWYDAAAAFYTAWAEHDAGRRDEILDMAHASRALLESRLNPPADAAFN